MRLKRAQPADAPLLRSMQVQAFLPLLEKYGDHGRSPAEETEAQVLSHIAGRNSFYYLMLVEDEPVGAIRVIDPGDGGVKRIAPVFVLPAFRRRGYATRAIREAERLHGNINWQLNTIEQEEGNCRLYERLGYRRMTTRLKINDREDIVFYAK